MNENIRFDANTIEIIEEKIDVKKAQQICKELFKNQETLWYFQLRNCKIDEFTLEKIFKYLQDCKHLSYLNLSLDVIDSFEKVKILSTYAQNFNSLTSLCLHSSFIQDDGLFVLHEALKNHARLTALDLGECRLTDDSVRLINDFIYTKSDTQKGLTELVLSGNNQITPNGWSEILLAIASCSDLKYLYVDYNNLSDLNGYLLVSIIACNLKLELIDLESTGLTDKSIKLIERVIRDYPVSLKKLNLTNNKINSKIIDKINSMLIEEDQAEFDLNLKNINDKIQPINPRENIKNDFKSLENQQQQTQDTKSFVQKIHKLFSKSTINKRIEASTEVIVEEAEVLKPHDDLRFKTHYVLPFNLIEN